MTDAAATPRDDRPQIEQLAYLTVTPVQQVCDWIMAHKLAGCRGCTGFRVEELGLADIIASPHSSRAARQGRADGSRPTFASA